MSISCCHHCHCHSTPHTIFSKLDSVAAPSLVSLSKPLSTQPLKQVPLSVKPFGLATTFIVLPEPAFGLASLLVFISLSFILSLLLTVQPHWHLHYFATTLKALLLKDLSLFFQSKLYPQRGLEHRIPRSRVTWPTEPCCLKALQWLSSLLGCLCLPRAGSLDGSSHDHSPFPFLQEDWLDTP